HGRCRERHRKGPHEIAGGIDLVELDDRLTHGVCEREQRAGLRMAPVMRAEAKGLFGARLPLPDGVELHGHFVARICLVEGKQMAAMANDADEGTVLERTRTVARVEECRIDRHRMYEATVNRATGAPFDSQAACLDETVAIAGPAVVEIHRVNH